MKKALSFMLVVMMLVCMLVSMPTMAFATGTEGVSQVTVEGEDGTEGEGGDTEGGGQPATPVENVNLAIENYSPTSMISGGEVTLNIVVSNNGDKIENAVLSIGGQNVATYGAMESGTSKTYSNSYNVSADKLDTDIEVVLTYTFDGATKTKKSSFKVAKKAASVQVSTAVKADNENVASGSKVVITFAIENKGNVKLENASITVPELNGGKPVSTAFSVEAGGSKVVTYTATITETTPIEPTLVYTADGKQYTEKMETLTINVDKVAMTVLASVSNAYPAEGDTITFTFSITNGGNISMKNLELVAPNGDLVALSSTTLPAEGTLEATYSIAPEESGLFVFTLNGEDENGDKYSYTSNMVDIVVQQAAAQDYTGLLTLVATADTDSYASDGIIKFNFAIENKSEVNFTDVRITEDSIGDLGLGTIDMLYPGEKTLEYQLDTELEKNSTFYFKLIAVDPDGYTIVVTANTIEIDVNKKGGSGMGFLVWLVIIILVLLLGGGIALLVLVVKEKKAQKAAPVGVNTRSVSRRTVQRPQMQRAERAEEINTEPEAEQPAAQNQPFAEELVVEEAVQEAEQLAQEAAEAVQEAEQPEIEELPQRKRERPAAPRRVIRSNDFVDRNNF